MSKVPLYALEARCEIARGSSVATSTPHHSYITQSVFEVVLHDVKSSTNRQLALFHYKYDRQVDGFA